MSPEDYGKVGCGDFLGRIRSLTGTMKRKRIVEGGFLLGGKKIGWPRGAASKESPKEGEEILGDEGLRKDNQTRCHFSRFKGRMCVGWADGAPNIEGDRRKDCRLFKKKEGAVRAGTR